METKIRRKGKPKQEIRKVGILYTIMRKERRERLVMKQEIIRKNKL